MDANTKDIELLILYSSFQGDAERAAAWMSSNDYDHTLERLQSRKRRSETSPQRDRDKKPKQPRAPFRRASIIRPPNAENVVEF